MDELTHFIVIRDYKPGDELQCREIASEGVMATVNNAFIYLVEHTFQLIVIITAVMFIYFGLPFTICLSSIPGGMLFMYICIWCGHKSKTHELALDMGNIARVYMSSDYTGFWVAEAVEPCFMTDEPSQYKYTILTENELKQRYIDTGMSRKTLVGTVGIVRSEESENYAWLRRMAVKPKYRKLGIGKALLNETLQFCYNKGYSGVELNTTEWNDTARNLYMKKGFQLKQMYHKQFFISTVTVLVYQLYYKFQPNKISAIP